MPCFGMATRGLPSPSLAELPSPWRPCAPVVTPTLGVLTGPKGGRLYKIPEGETVRKTTPTHNYTKCKNVRKKRGDWKSVSQRAGHSKKSKSHCDFRLLSSTGHLETSEEDFKAPKKRLYTCNLTSSKPLKNVRVS